MKKNVFIPLAFLAVSCVQENNQQVPAENPKNQSPVVDSGKTYSITKIENHPVEISDTVFKNGDEQYKVRIKNYAKGDFTKADTIDKEIYLYQEEFIDITINNKTTCLSKNNFASAYQNNNEFNHFCFGRAYIDSIDFTNKKIILSTFFGFRESDVGDFLKYTLSFDGQFEFLKIEEPKEESLDE